VLGPGAAAVLPEQGAPLVRAALASAADPTTSAREVAAL